jgi:G patch domain-containing protein 1
VLSGFVLSEKTIMEDRQFQLPEIPPGWQPNPRRVWEENKENISGREVVQEPMAHGKWKSSAMTAGEVKRPLVLLDHQSNYPVAG